MKRSKPLALLLSVFVLLTACTKGGSQSSMTNSEEEFVFGINNGSSDSLLSSEFTESGGLLSSDFGGNSSIGGSANNSRPSGGGGTSSSPGGQFDKPPVNGMTVAKVQMVNGTPRLMIDGQQVQPLMIGLDGTTTGENLEAVMNQIKVAGQNGVNLVVLTLDPSGLRYKDMFIDKLYDLVEQAYQANKNVKIILRYWVHGAPNFVGVDQSEQAVVRHSTAPDTPVEYSNVSLASDQWLEQAQYLTRNLCQLVIEDEFLNKIVIGYQPTACDAGEWIGPNYWLGGLDISQPNQNAFREYLKEKYKTDAALRSAWGDSSVTLNNAPLPKANEVPNPASATYSITNQYLMIDTDNQKIVDYLDYTNWLRAHQVNEICKVIKEETGGNSITLSFLGYHTEVYCASSNSFGMYDINNYTYVDCIGAPDSYEDRNEGGIGAFMGFAGSMAVNGKLWLDESDYRTPFKNSNGAEGTNPVGGGQDGVGDSMPFIKNAENAYEVGKRQIGKNMVFSSGEWFFDLVTRGWYDDATFWKKMNEASQLANKYQNFKKGKTAEVAIILDEMAMSLVGDRAVAQQLLAASRQTIYRSGLSYNFYLIDDLINGKLPDAKLYVMMTPWRLSDSDVAKLKPILQKSGKTTLWMYGAGDTGVKNFSDLTGMTIVETKSLLDNKIKINSNGAVVNGAGANPYYTVKAGQSGVQTLGVYPNASNQIAYAKVSKNGWNSIFYGSTNLDPQVLSYAAGIAGCNRFLDTSETGYADQNLYVLHTSTAGTKNIKFPAGTKDVYEYYTNKWYSGNSISFNAGQYKTYYFFYGNKAELQAAGIGK